MTALRTLTGRTSLTVREPVGTYTPVALVPLASWPGWSAALAAAQAARPDLSAAAWVQAALPMAGGDPVTSQVVIAAAVASGV